MDYDKWRIVPQYSKIRSRVNVDLDQTLGNFNISTCILPANMESVTSPKMCIEMNRVGGFGTLHRFCSIEENVKQFNNSRTFWDQQFVSIGVTGDSKERFEALYHAGAQFFIIDIAHGHSILMKEMVEYIRETSDIDLFIVGGNVGTVEAMEDLFSWSCNGVKIGLSSGRVCTTKDITGVSAGSIELYKAMHKQRLRRHPNKILIGDGGIRGISDVCKGIAAGMDYVMSGFLFAQCKEAAGNGVYRGMASAEAAAIGRYDNGYTPTPEGTSIKVETKYTVKELVEQVNGGLRSALSYSNSANLEQFRQRAILERI